MAIRTFLFCDVCNKQGIRYVEQRRDSWRGQTGKRITDDRAWFEGSLDNALKSGWIALEKEEYACPRCAERMQAFRNTGTG